MSKLLQNSKAKLQGIVDICILVDATASMQPCIDDIKDNIRLLIKCINSPEENGGVEIVDWRACVWGYRDFTYDPLHGVDAIIKRNFTRDLDELEEQLSSLQAMGGGPVQESLLDALMEVCQMGYTERGEAPEPDKWRYRSEAARCVIVFTDAPFYSDLKTMPGATIDEVIQFMGQARLRLSLFAPEMPCHYALSNLEGSEYMYVELPRGETGVDEDSGEEYPDPRVCVQALRDYTSDKQNFSRVIQQIGKSISSTSTKDTEEILIGGSEEVLGGDAEDPSADDSEEYLVEDSEELLEDELDN